MIFNIIVFFIALIIAFTLHIIFPAEPKVILKFPNITNLDTVYKDQTGQCYRYSSRNVKCTSNTKSFDLA